ncbi:PLP-dependent transferase [Xylariaceae sp. FL0662B]|nr:PLP-dependent transferase [Xylariaceae sp. FL0662B]
MSSPTDSLVTRIKGQQLHPHSVKALPTFYRNLEEALDVRRSSHSFYSIVQNSWRTSNAVDFCSGDVLGLGTSDARRAEFLAELARHPDFSTGSSGVRLMDGSYTYLEQVEREIASLHGAEAGLIVGSAFEANVAVWTALLRPGDVVVHDALVHASTHEGVRQGSAMQKVEFPHNDVEGFRRALLQGKCSIVVAVESIYSIDGDVCPLRELVDVAKELFRGQGNVQFIVDEAHSVSVIGPKGTGLVCELGLEKEIAVVVHSFGKAIGATGGNMPFYHTRQQDHQRHVEQFCTVRYIYHFAVIPVCRGNQIWIHIISIWPNARTNKLLASRNE